MRTNKLAIVMAVAAACAGVSASAQDKNPAFSFYGKFYPYILSESGTGATSAGTSTSTLTANPTGKNLVGNEQVLSANNSRVGFRGKQSLGNDANVIFQAEGALQIDTGTQGSSTSNVIWNRNTFLGLEGSMGTLKVGNMDTIFKDYGDTLGILGISSGTFLSDSDVLRKTGFGTSSSSSFHLRRSNAIHYETPEINDIQAGFHHSANEDRTNGRNPKVISMGVKYDKGPWYFALAHEIHYDLYGGSKNAPSARRNSIADGTSAVDTATQATVEWRMNKQHKFEFDIIRKDYSESGAPTGKFSNYNNLAFLLGTENRWSPQWKTAANFTMASAGSCTLVDTACDTDGLGATKLAVAVAYYINPAVNKDTFLFAAVNRLSNGSASRFSTAEAAGNGDAAPGETITQIAVGLSMSF